MGIYVSQGKAIQPAQCNSWCAAMQEDFRGYPFSEILLFSSSFNPAFIGSPRRICSGPATDRETVPAVPLSSGAPEPT